MHRILHQILSSQWQMSAIKLSFHKKLSFGIFVRHNVAHDKDKILRSKDDYSQQVCISIVINRK